MEVHRWGTDCMRPRFGGLGQIPQRNFWHSQGCGAASRTTPYQPSAAERSQTLEKVVLHEQNVARDIRHDASKRAVLKDAMTKLMEEIVWRRRAHR